MHEQARIFGVLSDGRAVKEYTLTNRNGIVAKVLNYGGIIRVLEVPGRSGQTADIVLGFDTIEQYEAEHPYFGAIVGRVAGRIGAGRLPVGNTIHQLPINSAPDHLHGGDTGFDHRLWDSDFCEESQSLTLSYESPAGEEGYPGRLSCRVSYRLTDANDLAINYQATTDAPTVVNLTQHSYFNLSGNPGETVLDHILRVPCDKVLELDENAMPTGRETGVAGSKLDFRESRLIGPPADRNATSCESRGLDNFWVLPTSDGEPSMKLAAELLHKVSGRVLRVETTAPGTQIYSGTAIPSNLVGKKAARYGPFSGICFETQTHPDSPNHTEFPSILLDAGETYQSSTVFRFGTR